MNFSPIRNEGYANSGSPMAPPSNPISSWSSQGPSPMGAGFQPGGLSAAVRAMQMPGGMPFAQQALRINAGLPAQGFGGGGFGGGMGGWGGHGYGMGLGNQMQQQLYAGGPGQAFMGGGSPQTMPMPQGPQMSPNQQLAAQMNTMSRSFYSPFNSPYGGQRDQTSNYGRMASPPQQQAAPPPPMQTVPPPAGPMQNSGVAGPQMPPWGAQPQPLWNQPISGADLHPSGWTPGYGVDPAVLAASRQGAMFPGNY